MTHRDPALDLLRGLAALGVVAFHYLNDLNGADPAVPLFAVGRFGVEVFFAISGYVIVASARRSPSRRAFVAARVRRLWPTFAVSATVTATWLAVFYRPSCHLSPVTYVLNLTMVPTWFGAPPADPVYWTLAYEIAFYAAVAALLPLVKTRFILVALAGLVVAAFFPFCAFFVLGSALRRLFPTRTVPLPYHLVPFALWLGRISYPLYLTHNVVGHTVILALRSAGWPFALAVTALLAVGLAAAIDALCNPRNPPVTRLHQMKNNTNISYI